MALTAKMKAFAQAVVDGLSNKDAAISAGYSEKSAMQQGSKLAKIQKLLPILINLNQLKS
jgi:phage terminase small subunit